MNNHFAIGCAAASLLPALLTGFFSLIGAIVGWLLKTKADERQRTEQKLKDLTIWVYQMGNLMQRSQTAASYFQDITALISSASEMNAITRLHFPTLQPAVDELIAFIEKYHTWAEATTKVNDPYSPHAIGEQKRFATEIDALVQKFETEARKLPI